MPATGDLLGAKYRVLAKLGEGGMGIVFEAENVLTGRHVALKWMHPHHTRSPDAAERLLREARAGSRLSHPNVCDVYDVVHDGETLFLVMELLRGETLRDYLRRDPTPPVHEFIGLLLPALAGVAAAHEMSVIHRDLKPDNIFLVRGRGPSQLTAKVVDFGIAKLTGSSNFTLTETGTALGTPHYMSLEQLRGDRDVDGRADVYAFGVMLYEAVTGRMPYAATTLSELAIKVATTDPAPVKELRPDVPTALARLIDWSLERDRTRRLPDIRTLHTELESFARETTFRDQMTLPNAPAPRLAGGDAARAAEPEARDVSALAAPPAPQLVAAAQPAEPIATPDPPATPAPGSPDTFTGRELRSGSRAAKPRRRAWVLGALATALLFAAAILYQSQESPPPPTAAVSPPSQPPASATSAPVEIEPATARSEAGAVAPAPTGEPIVSPAPAPAVVGAPAPVEHTPIRARVPARAVPSRPQLTSENAVRPAPKAPPRKVQRKSAAEILAF